MALRGARRALAMSVIGGARAAVQTYQSKVQAIPNLIAYWPLTETEGPTANDVSGNARHGTYTGVTLADAAGPGPDMGNAPLFDSTDFIDVFSASLAGAFTTPAHTISAWIKMVASGWDGTAFKNVFIAYDGSKSSSMYKANAAARFTWSAGGTELYSKNSIAEYEWVHVALVRNGTVLKAYWDGEQDGGNVTITNWASTITSCKIGTNAGATGSHFTGHIGHVAVFARALSDDEIADLATPT